MEYLLCAVGAWSHPSDHAAGPGGRNSPSHLL